MPSTDRTNTFLDTRTQPLVPGSKPYTDLEVFMTALTNGYPISVPAERDW